MTDDEIIKEILSIPHRCNICERLDNFEFTLMSKIQYEITVDDGAKSELRANGLCNHHFWAVASLTTNKTAAAMCRIFFDGNGFSQGGCLICRHLTQKENELLGEFVQETTEAAVNRVQRFEKSLCSPHFRLVMGCLDANAAEYLTEIQREHTEKLVRELNSFEEKNRFDQNRDEKNSWWRAVENLVGRKGMTRRSEASKR